MTPAEKRRAIAYMQKRIDSSPYAKLINYPCCAVCFVRLTEHNILEEDGHLVDVCIDCKDK